MFDTPITMVGTVLTAPQWRRTTQTGTFMVTFRVAATSRRFVREQNAWVDGDSLRVRVTCWRRLAENVSVSVQLGDPVIVHGRLYTRDWTDDEGRKRTSFELEAVSVGHDLSRGVDKFARRRAVGGTDMLEGPSSDARVGGELTEEVDDPGRPADLPAEHELFEPFDAAVFEESTGGEPVGEAGLSAYGAGRRPGSSPGDGTGDEDSEDVGDSADSGGAVEQDESLVGAGSGRGRRSRSQ